MIRQKKMPCSDGTPPTTPNSGKPSSTKRPSTRPTPLARRSTTSSPPPLLPGCTNHHGLRRRSIPRCPSGHPRRSARGPTAREQPERIPAVQFRRARNATQIPDWDRSLVIRLTRSRNRRDSPTGSKQVWGEFEHVLSLVLRHHHGETGEQTEEDDQHRDRQRPQPAGRTLQLTRSREAWRRSESGEDTPVLVVHGGTPIPSDGGGSAGSRFGALPSTRTSLKWRS
jgi:hypothetical protein